MGSAETVRGGTSLGAAAVEFAIILIPLAMILFGTIQFGIAYNRVQGMQAAVREGARLASLGATDADVLDRIEHSLPGSVRFADLDIAILQFEEGEDASDPSLGEGAPDPVCGDRTQSVGIFAEVARNFDHYTISIPFVPQFGPTFATDGIFRCEVSP